jgi:hypothetical protein
MGGCGSGNYYRCNTERTLDEYRNLDINRMMKMGAIRDGCVNSGNWLWVDKKTGKKNSEIGYECNALDKADSYLRLSYKFTDTDHSVDYKIRLVRTYPRYGGVRFWFICPERGKRVAKLYLIPSDGRFVSRHVYKVYYASQMKGKLDRAIDKKWKLLDKVEGKYFPQRPKGMHQKTFDRIVDKFTAQEESCDWMMIQRFGKMGLEVEGNI